MTSTAVTFPQFRKSAHTLSILAMRVLNTLEEAGSRFPMSFGLQWVLRFLYSLPCSGSC